MRSLIITGLLSAVSACSTDDDCHLNGICSSGACKCVPEWTGEHCGVLALEPARVRPRSGYDEGTPAGDDHVSSWGGSIIADPTNPNLYHMFVSRMGGHCGLNSWRSDSEIVHATSTDPVGPYSKKETILPHFAHGPSVRALPDGKGFFMMHLGCGYPFTPFKNCTRSGKMVDATGREASPPTCNQFNVSVMTATSPNGPWSGSQAAGGRQVYLSSGSRPANESWYVPSGRQFSNPAPYFLPNGSILCAYRADARSGGEHVSVALAASADASEFVDSRGAAAVGSQTGEDQFLWQDERGHCGLAGLEP